MIGRYGKRLIYGRDAGKCVFCAKPVSYSDSTLDHVIPRAKGGTNNIWNLCIAHAACNTLKGSKVPDEQLVKLIRRRTENYFRHTLSYYTTGMRGVPPPASFIEMVEEIFGVE